MRTQRDRTSAADQRLDAEGCKVGPADRESIGDEMELRLGEIEADGKATEYLGLGAGRYGPDLDFPDRLLQSETQDNPPINECEPTPCVEEPPDDLGEERRGLAQRSWGEWALGCTSSTIACVSPKMSVHWAWEDITRDQVDRLDGCDLLDH